jgi:hypothetical protein
MAKVYVKVLDLDPKSEAAQKLIHWKIPRPGAVCFPYGSINRFLDVHVDIFPKKKEATGDFPHICYEAIKARQVPPKPEDIWTVDAVNQVLDRLAVTRGNKV